MRMRSTSPQAFWDGLRDESGAQGVSGTAPAWPTFGLSRSTCDGKLRRLSESMFGFAMTKVESCSTANRLCRDKPRTGCRMEGTAPPILGRDILPDSRLDRRLSRPFSPCAPLHLHCLIFFPDSVRLLPLVSTVMVPHPPRNP